MRVWRRWPAQNGQGVISLPFDDALYALSHGVKFDGKVGEVVRIDDLERDGSVSLVVRFEGWTQAHP